MPIDNRAYLPHPLDAPAPLPHVSRRALMRVRDALPPPEQCPYCQGPVRLVNNAEIYNGKSYGKWPYAYRCAPCDAYVGLHPDTDIPLGTLAMAPLRQARQQAKQAFFDLCRRRSWERNDAYPWLAKQMGIEQEVCHFGMFDEHQAQRAGQICRAAMAQPGSAEP